MTRQIELTPRRFLIKPKITEKDPRPDSCRSVDPAARTIEVLNRGERGWMVSDSFGGEGEARIPPFDAVAFDIGALWDVSPPAGQTP
jgi:hypothetical protein